MERLVQGHTFVVEGNVASCGCGARLNQGDDEINRCYLRSGESTHWFVVSDLILDECDISKL